MRSCREGGGLSHVELGHSLIRRAKASGVEEAHRF